MRTRESLFDEVAAALQFPEYFGENWYAFADCLSDMAWWPADRRRIIVWDATYVLPENNEEYSLLLDILKRVVTEWSTNDEFRETCPLDVVFHTEESDTSDLKRRLDEFGVEYTVRAIRK
jgi:RNAse (barnase) inhibitor barstar